jgi:hypothetical protein
LCIDVKGPYAAVSTCSYVALHSTSFLHAVSLEYFASADIIFYEYYFHYWQCSHHSPCTIALVKYSACDARGNYKHQSAA